MQRLLKEPFSGFSTQQSTHLPPIAHQLMETFRAGNHSFSCVEDDDADAGDDVTMMMMVAKMVMVVMTILMVVIHQWRLYVRIGSSTLPCCVIHGLYTFNK